MEATTFALPATPRQIAYARSLALRNQTLLPWEIQQDRRSLSAWIDAQAQMKPLSALDSLPSSKQVAFAERLARAQLAAAPNWGGERTPCPACGDDAGTTIITICNGCGHELHRRQTQPAATPQDAGTPETETTGGAESATPPRKLPVIPCVISTGVQVAGSGSIPLDVDPQQAPITAAASHGLAGALSEIERAVADQLTDGYVMDLDIRALNLEMQEVAHLGAGDKVTPRSRAMALWERRLMAG